MRARPFQRSLHDAMGRHRHDAIASNNLKTSVVASLIFDRMNTTNDAGHAMQSVCEGSDDIIDNAFLVLQVVPCGDKLSAR